MKSNMEHNHGWFSFLNGWFKGSIMFHFTFQSASNKWNKKSNKIKRESRIFSRRISGNVIVKVVWPLVVVWGDLPLKTCRFWVDSFLFWFLEHVFFWACVWSFSLVTWCLWTVMGRFWRCTKLFAKFLGLSGVKKTGPFWTKGTWGDDTIM